MEILYEREITVTIRIVNLENSWEMKHEVDETLTAWDREELYGEPPSDLEDD